MQHFTRNTVSTTEWCAKCGKRTEHRVDGVKLGPCLRCMERLEAEKKLRDAHPLPQQEGFKF